MAVYPLRSLKKVIDELGGRGIDARDLFEIGEPGARNRLCRSERMQQGALADRSDPADLVERALGDVLLAARAVGADGEAMRLVAQPLHEIKRRVARREPERRPVGEEKSLAPGVAIGPFGDRSDRHTLDAEFGEGLARRRELTVAAIDEDQVGPLRKSIVLLARHRHVRCAAVRFRLLLLEPRKPAPQHFAPSCRCHRPRRASSPLMLKVR